LNKIGTQPMETARLLLRAITMEDAQDMFDNWASDPEVARYVTWQAHRSLEDTRTVLARWEAEYERDDCFRWCIVPKAACYPVGMIDVVSLKPRFQCAEIGYVLSRKWWGQGIMTQALTAVEGYLFEKVGLNRVEARHITDNPASRRVMVKAGMRYEGTGRQDVVDNQGHFRDTAHYAILREDWEQKR
jgi:ribosomal-protein-alanine N-acetyltransferase